MADSKVLSAKIAAIKTQLKQKHPNIKIFNTRDSERRYHLFLKANFINFRITKNDKYTKLRTDKYESYDEMLRDNAHGDYIQNSLNAFTRCSVIIDCDSNDSGEATRNILNKLNIKWQYSKVRSSNGHSQTAIDIHTCKVYDHGFNEQYMVSPVNYKDRVSLKRMYLTVTYLLNHLANGDIDFTGSNCQNPYCTINGYTIWNENSYKYNIMNLYKLVMNYFNFEWQYQADDYIKNAKRIIHAKKQACKQITEDNSSSKTTQVFYWEDLLSPQELKAKLKEMDDEFEVVETKTVKFEGSNNKLYRLVNEHFAFMLRRNLTPTITSTRNRILRLVDSGVESFSYNPMELEQRIISTFKSVSKTFDLSKAGYTDQQRELSKSIRSAKQFDNYLAVQRYKRKIKQKKITIKEVAKILGISRTTVYKYLKFDLKSIDLTMLGYSLNSKSSKEYKDAYQHLYRTAYKKIYSLTHKGQQYYYKDEIFIKDQNGNLLSNSYSIDWQSDPFHNYSVSKHKPKTSILPL